MKVKARREIAVIEHFTPETIRGCITDDDRVAFERWSSAGVRCEPTEGFKALQFGKTMRDAMVATLRVDLADGVFWRHEFADGFPADVGRYLDRATRGVNPRPEVWRALFQR